MIDPQIRGLFRFGCRAGKVVAGVMLAANLVALAGPISSARAAGTLAGAAETIIPKDGRFEAGMPITSGDRDTEFSLKIPVNGACPLDTATGNWNWSTYMVPISVDPATLTFDSTGPTPQGVGVDFRQPLYTPGGGSPIVQQATDPADDPGGPGLISDVRAASFGVIPEDFLPSGSYNVGVACHFGPPSNPDQLGPFWNVVMVIVANGPDISWEVMATATTTTTPGSTTTTPGSTTTTPGSTTTTPGSTTTTPGSTTTTPGSTTTTPGSTTTTDVTGGSSTTSDGTASVSGSRGLAITGSDVFRLVVWGVLLVVFGRMAILFARPSRRNV